MNYGRFATVINCMDGRVQECVNEYMKETYGVKYVDTITLAGACQVLAENKHSELINNIKFQVDISVNKHLSKIVAIAGHADCAAVSAPDEQQKQMVTAAIEAVRKWKLSSEVIGLWIGTTWMAERII